ncbi:uncharacterized protein LOC133303882 [Gastrolobium bilobum]|uniref:uncharacterized protein LOC133303882 n=1 Tax=Gastrolobium bilobum TaxID=150636 RepID=UPI002AB1A5E7|nr:uncharacterized protein LOC133303882 [Gastrolobium bilobum]
MSFGLKNSGATYQRMMNKVLEDQLGKNVEVYIDDMIVKSFDMTNYVQNLEQTFRKLRKYRIRLNPVKCSFGVPAGKFLGFMLTHRGIEANPDKCKEVLDMKEAIEGWNPECQAAFNNVKKCLATPPVLSKPDPGDILILYLAVGEETTSAVLIKETNEGQEPIYFVSRALQGANVRYQKLEKVAFALLITARRLRPYFQGHQIIVRTNQPIWQVFHKPDLVGRMTNWAIELSEYDIAYESRKAIKSQALADFVMELTPLNLEHEESGGAWKVYVDGSSNNKGRGAGIILESLGGVTIEHSLNLGFPTSNNQVEYEALIAGLMQAKEHGARKVQIFSDSQLVTSQIEGKYQAKGPLLIKYLNKVQEIMAGFDEVQVTHIPRWENSRADILSKLASTKNPGNHGTVVQQSMTMPSCVMVITSANDWRKPIVDYLEKGILPEDRLESRKLVRDATQYIIVNDQLFGKGLHIPMLKCLNSEGAEYVLAEIHEGINDHHMSGKALARKALRAGYYWPTMEADSKEHVKKCDSCQKHAKLIISPPEELKCILAPWPFFKWGMNLLGPFKAADGKLKWLIVAVDYFTKWIEAEPVTTITSARVQRFFERNIVSRFGIPVEVVTDNGTQFADKRFRQLMKDLQVTHRFASVEHPQSNGQAETANKVIVNGLKKRMFDAKESWVQQLYFVLWGYRTSTQTATGETLYRLMYGCEAMILVEVGEPSWRRMNSLGQGEQQKQ